MPVRRGPARSKRRIRIRERTNGAWHIYVPDIGPGQLYGYRVLWTVSARRADCASIPTNCCSILTPRRSGGSCSGPMSCSAISWATRARICRSTIATARRSRRWARSSIPASIGAASSVHRYPAHETLIYEAHVRGMTQLHPEVPKHLRGTYAGMASEPIIEHLQKTGRDRARADAGALFRAGPASCGPGPAQLLGLQHPGIFRAGDELRLQLRESPDEAVREFKGMVKILHNAGIEVILDVVYNHTAEGNQAGPTLSFRGIDNLAYYRTMPGDPRHYMDYHGLRQHPEHGAPAFAAAADGQPALLGHGNARRWLPVRSRLGAGARAEGRRSTGRVLRHDLPGSDAWRR